MFLLKWLGYSNQNNILELDKTLFPKLFQGRIQDFKKVSQNF